VNFHNPVTHQTPLIAFPLGGTACLTSRQGRGLIKNGPRIKRDPSVNIFCNNNRLPADPDMETEVIKPIKIAVVTK